MMEAIKQHFDEALGQHGVALDDLISSDTVLGFYNDFLSPEKIVLAVCEAYIEAEASGHTGRFPFAEAIEAWQKNSTAIEATKEYDDRRPAGILKYPMGSIRDLSLVDAKVGILKQFSGHGDTPSDYQMTLPGAEQETIIRPTQNFWCRRPRL